MQVIKMRVKDFSVSVWWSVLVISLPTVYSSGWKPIVPPEEYFATKPIKCITDCDAEHKYPFRSDANGVQGAETQLKSTLLSPSFTQEKTVLPQINKKLDLEILKPTKMSIFPSGEAKRYDSSLTSYQEVFKKFPSNFFSFKTYGGPGKTTKTVYLSDLEIAKPKFPSDVKYYKPYKQSFKQDVQILKPTSFLENEVGSYQALRASSFSDHCSLYKVSFRQDLYYQYIQYKVHMPELKEFTLCLWARFHNHSHDHSLFSYGAKPPSQGIYMWVSNLNEPALFNMKVLGQTIFRLNYPIKLYKWYHTCQSWNGNTGEWQVWVNSHRIGRGFHNLLVNHPIPGGGVALSGQEHKRFTKGFQEVPKYFKEASGLEGEITMLQMYKVALSAGKAYNDHSHHHSHYASTTPEPPELPSEEPKFTTEHPLLENGQLKTHVNVLELAEALKKGHLDTHFEHGEPHLGGQAEHHSDFEHAFEQHLPHSYVSHIAPLGVHGNTLNFVGLPSHAIFKRNDETKAEEIEISKGISGAEKNSTGKVKVVSNVTGQVQVEKIIFSREGRTLDYDPMVALPANFEISNATSEESKSVVNEMEDENIKNYRAGRRLRRHNPSLITPSRPKRIATGETKPRYYTYRIKKKDDPCKRKTTGCEASKRHTFENPYFNFGPVGLTSHDIYPFYSSVPYAGFSYEQFPNFGSDSEEQLAGGNQSMEDSSKEDIDKPIKKEVELAEGEVRRVMELCSGCHSDPFRKVAVISWRSTPKKIYSGTLFLKAKSECENF